MMQVFLSLQSIDQSMIHASVNNDNECYNYVGCDCSDCSVENCPCRYENMRAYDGSRRLILGCKLMLRSKLSRCDRCILSFIVNHNKVYRMEELMKA